MNERRTAFIVGRTNGRTKGFCAGNGTRARLLCRSGTHGGGYPGGVCVRIALLISNGTGIGTGIGIDRLTFRDDDDV